MTSDSMRPSAVLLGAVLLHFFSSLGCQPLFPEDADVKPDKCSLEFVSVELTTDNDANSKFTPSGGFLYFPASVRVPRCTGYCGATGLESEIRQCMAAGILMKEVPQIMHVLVSNATRPVRHVEIRRRIVKVVTHTSCRCGCRANPAEACPLPVQQFDPDRCRCDCTNIDYDCPKRHFSWGNMFWDETRCQCRCPQFKTSYAQLVEPPPMCSTFFYFDHTTCQCLPKPKSRKRFKAEAFSSNTRFYEHL